MTYAQASKLKVGARLLDRGMSAEACTGTVIETGYNAVKIKWDDGQVGIVRFHDMEDMTRHIGDTRIVPARA